MRLEEHIAAVEAEIADARRGVPQAVFDFLGRVTPLVNVDLLIQNDRGQTLLTWRHDNLYRGWHIPGGVVRFKELMADRIAAVALNELGTTVTAALEPKAIHQI